MKLNICDDDGFIAVVNNSNYQSFVAEDWDLDQLMTHFVDQMNSGNIVIWQTSNDGGGNWLISFQDEPTGNPVFREFEQLINVTNKELFLTNYSDLSMAAQFSDEVIPAKHNADLKIDLENGWYKLTVRQLFDPNNTLYLDDQTDEDISFEIIIRSITESTHQKINNIHWRGF